MCAILYIHDPSCQCNGLTMAQRTFLALSTMQHRGQDGGGYGYTDGQSVSVGKFFNEVARQHDASGAHLDPPRPYTGKLGDVAERNPFKLMAHLRYSTAGGAFDLIHYQPHYMDLLEEGRIVYAANGDIPNLAAEREKLIKAGIDVRSGNDGELTLRKICQIKGKNGCTWIEAIHLFMKTTPAAYSGILMTKNKTYFIRDPWGFRPFIVGLINGTTIVAASESSALDILGAEFDFEVDRGSVVEIENDGTMSIHQYPWELPKNSAHCDFCVNYFASPASKVFVDHRPWEEVKQKGSYAYAFGQQLAEEHPVEADFVASIPNSGDLASKGYAIRSEIPERQLFIRNIFVPRTFIMSQQQERELLIRLKFGLMTDMLRKFPRVCLVDDSIVRASTLRGIQEILRQSGAEEVHIRISFPPITHPCFMGIAMPTKEELIASGKSIKEIQQYLNVDSLGYLSQEGHAAVLKRRGHDPNDFCRACHTGQYPIPV